MTAFNEELYIEDTLLALKNQTYANWELLVVDDGSTDRTGQILDNFAKEDVRVKVFHTENKGRIPALNQGLSEARGEYVAVNDADDVSLPSRFEKQVDYLDNNHTVGMLGTYAKVIDEHSSPTGGEIVAPQEHDKIKRVMLRYNPFVHSSVMYRQQALQQAGSYTDKFLPGFEWEMYAKIMKHWKVANLGEYLVNYRVHAKSLTRTRKAWQRLSNSTRARWFVFRELSYPLWQLPFIFFGILDFLPKRK